MISVDLMHWGLAIVWRRRYMVAVPIILMPIIGMLVSTHAPQEYLVQTSLLIQEGAEINPTLKDLSVETNYRKRMAALSLLLHSRHVLTSVAEELGLVNDKMSKGARDWVIQDLSNHLSVEAKATHDEDYDEMVMGTRKKSTKWQGEGLLFIRYRSKDPSTMVAIVEAVRKHFLRYVLAPAALSLEESQNFLETQLTKLRSELTEAETALARFKSEHAEIMPDLREDYGYLISEMENRLHSRKSVLTSSKDELRRQEDALLDKNPLVRAIDERIINLESQLALYHSRYTDAHSKVKDTKKTISHLREQRESIMAQTHDLTSQGLERLWQLAQGAANELGDKTLIPGITRQLKQIQEVQIRVTQYEEEIQAVQNMIADLENKHRQQGEKEDQLKRLERDIATKRELYHQLAERYDNAKISRQLSTYQQAEMVQVVDPPREPSEPTSPARYWYFITGIIGGIALGLGLAIATESSDKSIRRTQALREMINKPVVSRVPVLDAPGTRPSEI
jgi:uncharacterized protein involved in exopolysaccharide biosynthesis